MAFAITKCKAYGIQSGAATRSKGIQVVELELTGTTSDVDMDLGDDDGTFWGDVETSSPTVYANALALFQKIGAGALGFLDIKGPQLFDRVQVASLTTTGQILKAVEENRPNISFNAADGEETYQLVLTWMCGQSFSPVVADLVE